MLLLRIRSPGAVTQNLVRARARTALPRVGGIYRWSGPNGTRVGSSTLPVCRIFSSSSSSSSRIVSNLDGAVQPSPAEEAVLSSNKHTKILASAGTSSYARNAAALALTALIGFGMGRWSVAATNPPLLEHENNTLLLPNGLPRTCCEKSSDQEETNNNNNNHTSLLSLTDSQQELLRRYRRLVGNEHVLDCTTVSATPQSMAPYLVGARIGGGDDDEASPTLCIVSPTYLHHVADIVEWAVQADCVVLVQGQNTGLTGGSVPHTHTTQENSSRRPIVVLSMKQLTGIVPLDDGQRVVCMAGVGLASVSALSACVYYFVNVYTCVCIYMYLCALFINAPNPLSRNPKHNIPAARIFESILSRP